MENKYQEEERYFKAKKRVEVIKDFYGHILSFIVISGGLFVFNIVASPNYLWFDYWFYWNLLLWAIAVVIHGFIVFNGIPFLGKNWEEKKIRAFIKEEEKTKETKTNFNI